MTVCDTSVNHHTRDPTISSYELSITKLDNGHPRFVGTYIEVSFRHDIVVVLQYCKKFVQVAQAWKPDHISQHSTDNGFISSPTRTMQVFNLIDSKASKSYKQGIIWAQQWNIFLPSTQLQGSPMKRKLMQSFVCLF